MKIPDLSGWQSWPAVMLGRKLFPKLISFRNGLASAWTHADRRVPSILAAVVCFVVAFFLASGFLAGKDARDFRMWQEWYSPAVGMACGHGYRVIPFISEEKEVTNWPLKRFLKAKKQTFDCNSIELPIPERELSRYHHGHRYLIGTVGMLWKFTGPDWQAVKMVIALLFALCGLAAYLLCRSLLGTVLAATVAILFAMSPANLEEITRLRDLGKVPFILLSCAIMLWAVRLSRNRRWYLSLAAVTGLTIGLGFGFRTDVAMMVLPGALLISMLGQKSLGWWRLMAGALVVGTFAVSASPLMRSYEGGGNMAHAVILGLSDYSNYQLGIQPGNYAWGVNHFDLYVVDAMNAYYAMQFEGGEGIESATSEYNRAGVSYLLDMFFTFPGDMLLRVEAAARELTSQTLADTFPATDLSYWDGWPGIVFLWLVFAGVLSMVRKDARLAAGNLLILAFLTAMVALQFQHRHYFYVEIFYLAGLAASLATLFALLFRSDWRRFVTAGLGGAAVLALVHVIISGVTTLQGHWVKPRLEDFLSSPRQELEVSVETDIVSKVSFPQFAEQAPEQFNREPGKRRSALPLVMTIDRSRCGPAWQYFKVKYYSATHLNYTFWTEPYPENKFGLHSTKFVLPNIEALGDVVQITIPMFRDGLILEEVELSPGVADCVVSWELLESDDATFNLMNWVVDEDRTLTPFRIMFSKPRP